LPSQIFQVAAKSNQRAGKRHIWSPKGTFPSSRGLVRMLFGRYHNLLLPKGSPPPPPPPPPHPHTGPHRHTPPHTHTEGISLGTPCRHHSPQRGIPEKQNLFHADFIAFIHYCVWIKSQLCVLDFLQVARLLERAARNRAVAATHCNERSSRSHSVFRLKLTGKNGKTRETCEGMHVVLQSQHQTPYPKGEGGSGTETSGLVMYTQYM